MQARRSTRQNSQHARNALQDVTNIVTEEPTQHQAKQPVRRNAQTKSLQGKSVAGNLSVPSGESTDKRSTMNTGRHNQATRSSAGKAGQVVGRRQGRGPGRVSKTDGDEIEVAPSETQLLNQVPLDDSMDSSHVDVSDDNNMFSFTGSLLQATPLAKEASSMALKRFKRRPRQLSMLTMVQQRIASARSSLAAPGFDHESAAADDDDFDDIEDDFQPDLAGTPAKRDRLSLTSDSSLRHISRSRTSPGPIGVLNADAGHAAAANRRLTRSSQNLQPRRQSSKTGHDDDHERRMRLSTSTISANASDFVTAHDAYASSDDQQHSVMSPDLASRNNSRVEPCDIAASPEDSSIFADPLTQQTPSPDQGRGKRRRLHKVPSTANLQSMLPRRRRVVPSATAVRYDDFDYSSDTTESAGDESFRLESTARPYSRQGALRANGHFKARSNPQEMSPNVVASKSRKNVSRGKAGQKAPRTALHHANDTVDLRDEHVPDDTAADNTSVYVTSLSDDLEAAKRKFAEIDQWEMDFETVTPEDTISSSQGWR